MRGSTLILLVCILAGTLVLGALGTWQVKRLFWKEGLIETINNRVDREPIELISLAGQRLNREKHEYLPVSAKGIFDHSSEVYFFTTGPRGVSGWNVHTSFELDGGKRLIINRGFVPFEMKNPSSRPQGQVTGEQKIDGLLRVPMPEKPFGSLDNDLAKREFYWRSLDDMKRIMGNREGEYLPVIIDATEASNPSGWPRGGTTILSFPNNHLQYAITWYGLVLALWGVGFFFLYSRRREKNG
ncbi:MAG: SURF1 family protein [Rhizobiaceae bacterium]